MQIGPCQREVRCAITVLHALTQAQTPHHAVLSLAGMCVAHHQVLRLKSHLLQSFAQAPSLQMAQGIGAKLNTRPLLRPRQLVFPDLQLQGWPMRSCGGL